MEPEIAPWEQDWGPTPTQEIAPWDEDYSAAENLSDSTSGSKGQEVVNLPPPRPNMFADMDDADAAALYAAYERHPNTQQAEDGSLIHNGAPVPPPEGNTRGITPYLDSATGLPGGIYNAGRNLVLGAAAGGQMLSQGVDALGDAVLPEFMQEEDEMRAARLESQNESYRWLEDSIPKFNSKGAVQGAGEVIGEIGTGIVAGNKVLAGAKLIGGGKKALSYLADKVVKTLASGIGTAATVDGKSDTLVTGDTALMPIGIGLDGKSKSEAQAALEGRFNVLIDTFLVGAPVEMFADGGKLAIQAIYRSAFRPIKAGLDDSTKELVTMEAFMANIANAVDAGNPGSPKAKMYMEKALNILRDPENHEIFFASTKDGLNDVRQNLDTATVINRGFADDASPEADAIRKLFNEKRKAVLERGGDHVQTSTVTQRIEDAPRKYLDNATEAYGGKEGIENSAKDIRTSGRQEVSAVEDVVNNTTLDLEKTQEAYPQIVSDSPAVGGVLTDAATDPGSVGLQGRNKVVGEIRDALAQGKSVMKPEKDRLWKNIPEGLPVDEESLGLAITNASDAMTPDLKKALKASGVTISKTGEVTGGDFAKLQQNMRKPLKNAIENYTSKGNAVPESLYALRENITKYQPDFLAGPTLRGQLDEIDPDEVSEVTEMLDEGRESVKKAVDYTRDVYAPNVKDAVSLRIEQINQNPKLGRSQKLDEIDDAINTVITKKTPNEGRQFLKTLALDEFGNNDKLVPEYIKQSIGDTLRTQVTTGGLKTLRAKDILDAFKPYRQILNSNPEHFADYLGQIDELEKKLLDNAGNEEALTKLLTTQTKDLDVVREKIYLKSLNDFFEKDGTIKPDGFRSFTDLFSNVQTTGPKEAGKLDGVIQRAKKSDDPMVLEGMKAAWLRHTKDLAFSPAPNAASGKSIRTAKTSEILEGENNVLEIGRKLFAGDAAGVPETVVALLDPSLNLTLAKKGASFKGGASAQSTRNEAMKGVTRVVMASVGPLTRIGARVSAGAGLLLDKLDPNDAAARIADAIMADPKEFARVYDRFYKNEAKSSENFRALFNFLTKAGIYNESDRNKWMEQALAINTDEQMETMFNEMEEERRTPKQP